ncbi:hypothetical protein KDA_50870 [Dictyobacter alpinus]|uniref:Uncharacterized protein n=1 Tax=Dictyobacter alpinus TaxID=2014873 RepID=A0A402BDY7_9CHLR|nr:hypothetical protein [Dictyobacter alpinus]GCE29603.1 hypothetical protein KDA_50870 [Dictyobacter alpinus]
MTLFSVIACCEQLTIDPKTLRRWLQHAGMSLQVHPLDRRLKCLTHEQVQWLATLHGRVLKPDEACFSTSLVETAPLGGVAEPRDQPILGDATLGLGS